MPSPCLWCDETGPGFCNAHCEDDYAVFLDWLECECGEQYANDERGE